MTENIYEELLPFWRSYIAAREKHMHLRTHESVVGAQFQLNEWYRKVYDTLGQRVAADMEWPEQVRTHGAGSHMPDSLTVDGRGFFYHLNKPPCIVQGVMMFTDPLDVFGTRTKRG